MKILLVIIIGLLSTTTVFSKQNNQSIAAIKQKIIEQSIRNYPGNCPCPYNTASNGSRCGKRSAYSRAGGYTPICYAEDITEKMVKEYKRQN